MLVRQALTHWVIAPVLVLPKKPILRETLFISLPRFSPTVLGPVESSVSSERSQVENRVSGGGDVDKETRVGR